MSSHTHAFSPSQPTDLCQPGLGTPHICAAWAYAGGQNHKPKPPAPVGRPRAFSALVPSWESCDVVGCWLSWMCNGRFAAPALAVRKFALPLQDKSAFDVVPLSRGRGRAATKDGARRLQAVRLLGCSS